MEEEWRRLVEEERIETERVATRAEAMGFLTMREASEHSPPKAGSKPSLKLV